MIGYTY